MRFPIGLFVINEMAVRKAFNMRTECSGMKSASVGMARA